MAKKKPGLHKKEDGSWYFNTEGCGCCIKHSEQDEGDFKEKVMEYRGLLMERMEKIEEWMKLNS